MSGTPSQDENPTVSALADLVLEAIDSLDAASEDPARPKVATAISKLAEAKEAYEAALKGDSRAEVEERFGRRMLDLLRQAAQLPAQRAGGI